jgi:tryptophanase
MLTDSGVNAMPDRQQAAMLIADDAWVRRLTRACSARSSKFSG